MSTPHRVLIAASILLVACGGDSDGTTAPNNSCAVTAPKGTMTASVNGAAFTANFIAQATIQNVSSTGPNIVQVNGVSCPATGAITGRQILFTVGRGTPITPGTYQLDAASQLQPPQSGYSGIGTMTLAPNLWYTNLSDATGPGSGSITFTTVTATRLAGTFQMVAVPVSSNESAARQRMTVTNGVFDVTVP